MNSKKIGERLKLYRRNCGWSLAECAEKIGISTKYLADIERGDKLPRLATFILILNTLSASADDVLQDNLVSGYQIKSNLIMDKLQCMNISHRKKALDMFLSIVVSLNND